MVFGPAAFLDQPLAHARLYTSANALPYYRRGGVVGSQTTVLQPHLNDLARRERFRCLTKGIQDEPLHRAFLCPVLGHLLLYRGRVGVRIE